MSALQWLNDFFEKRNISDLKPDGRPLFAYHCAREEYESLKALLQEAEKTLPGSSVHQGYRLSSGHLFAFYCAEWWRRNYSGGVWKWAPIIESLGWDHNTWNTRTNFVIKGLRYWGRDLIHTGAGTQYLLSVASEGGIPINVLERENASFKYYLKSVIRDYGHYANSGLTAERVAQDNLYKLPSSWQQEQIATLAGKLVEQLWLLKFEIGDSTDPVKTLNEIHPEWKTCFPIVLESEQAETLVNSLLNTARTVGARESQVIRLERNVEKTSGQWDLSASLLLPKEISTRQIEALSGLSATHTIPERLEMYRVTGDERILVARLSGEGETRFVRPVPGATQSYKENADKEHSLILMARGRDIASISVAGGEELDSALPWCLINLDDDRKHFRLVGQGGCQRREPTVFVLYSKSYSFTDNDTAVDLLQEDVLGRSLWSVSSFAEFCSDDEDEIYRIEPGLSGIAERDYRLIGNRSYFPKTRFSLYREMPKVQIVNDETVSQIIHNELVWRPIGVRKWRNFNQAAMIGDIEVRHRKDKVAFASWKLSILPKSAQILVEPVSRLEGLVKLNFPSARAAAINSMNGLETKIEPVDTGWNALCKRIDVSVGSICGDVSWENETRLLFSLPFPAEGVSFVDGEGKELTKSSLLTSSRLYGFRAQVVSLKTTANYVLRGSLSSSNSGLSAMQYHIFEYPISIDEFGVGILSLQQLKTEIDCLFAVSTGVDDKIKLEIIGSIGSRADATIFIQQFDGLLYVDQIRRLIYLSMNNSDYKDEYAGRPLQLIPVNNLDDEIVNLEWNNHSSGWTLPDYNDPVINLSNTYFAVLEGDASFSIRPSVIPPESNELTGDETDLVKAMTIADEDERLDAILTYLDYLQTQGNEDEWRELCAYIKRFSCIHPDGLDLVECLLEFPEVMAAIWFRSVPDIQLRDYLKKICESSPFSWWMISINQWVSAANSWLDSLSELPDSVRDILKNECFAALKELSSDNEEMNCIVDVLIEALGKELLENSVVSSIRGMPSEMIWKQLDQMSRGLYIPGYDGHWPKIGEVFEMRREISSDLYNSISWPIDDMSFQKPVIQAPVIAAAYLHEEKALNASHRIALLAARNFHPVAFATLFRAAQAVLWVNSEDISNE